MQCGRELGGGYCPPGTTCSPNGCLKILDEGFQEKGVLSNQTIHLLNATSNQTLGDVSPAINWTLTPRNQTENTTAVDLELGTNTTLRGLNQPVQKMRTETFTPTEPPQVTFTGVKFGEVAYVSFAYTAIPNPTGLSASLLLMAHAMWMILAIS